MDSTGLLENSLHLNVFSLDPLCLTPQSKGRFVQNRHVRAIEQRGLDPDVCGKIHIYIYTYIYIHCTLCILYTDETSMDKRTSFMLEVYGVTLKQLNSRQTHSPSVTNCHLHRFPNKENLSETSRNLHTKFQVDTKVPKKMASSAIWMYQKCQAQPNTWIQTWKVKYHTWWCNSVTGQQDLIDQTKRSNSCPISWVPWVLR